MCANKTALRIQERRRASGTQSGVSPETTTDTLINHDSGNVLFLGRDAAPNRTIVRRAPVQVAGEDRAGDQRLQPIGCLLPFIGPAFRAIERTKPDGCSIYLDGVAVADPRDLSFNSFHCSQTGQGARVFGEPFYELGSTITNNRKRYCSGFDEVEQIAHGWSFGWWFLDTKCLLREKRRPATVGQSSKGAGNLELASPLVRASANPCV